MKRNKKEENQEMTLGMLFDLVIDDQIPRGLEQTNS